LSTNQKWNGIERRESLRVEAEKLASRFYPEHLAIQPSEKLLHELLVHKIELELQLEELRLVYVSMQEKRDHYLDLYEFAPVGYLAINQAGLITEINQTGAALLGIERDSLLEQRLANLIIPADQDRWHLLFINLQALSKGEKLAFCLTFKRVDGMFSAYLDCQCWEGLDAAATWRFAMLDLKQMQKAISQVS
jgi:PAS domain S-box-containing protein